jgi:hypothetical protein
MSQKANTDKFDGQRIDPVPQKLKWVFRQPVVGY